MLHSHYFIIKVAEFLIRKQIIKNNLTEVYN